MSIGVITVAANTTITTSNGANWMIMSI
jgi:hypothetical protein